jgi:hypothetical protein
MDKIKCVGYFEGLGAVSYLRAPFDEEMRLFKKYSQKLISERQVAVARMGLPRADHYLSLFGSWTMTGDLYIPKHLAGKETIVLLKNSLVLEDPDGATNAHRKEQEYLVDNDKAMDILEKAKKGSDNYLMLQSTKSIPTNRFGEEAVPAFLFGDKASNYGLWLRAKKKGRIENGGIIKKMPLKFDSAGYINKQAGAYANQLWLGGLLSNSNIVGNNRYLCSDRAHGVQLTAEKPAMKKRLEDKII